MHMGELTNESFSKEHGRRMPLSHEVYTGSMFTDPRARVVGIWIGRVSEQDEEVQDGIRRGSLPVDIKLRLENQGFHASVSPSMTSSHGFVFHESGQDSDYEAEFRFYFWAKVEGDTLTVKQYQVPNDRRARHLVEVPTPVPEPATVRRRR